MVGTNPIGRPRERAARSADLTSSIVYATCIVVPVAMCKPRGIIHSTGRLGVQYEVQGLRRLVEVNLQIGMQLAPQHGLGRDSRLKAIPEEMLS